MPPVDLAELTSGAADVRATPSSHGWYRLALPSIDRNVLAQSPNAQLVPGEFGNIRLIVGTVLSWPSPVDYVGNARRRIAELRNAPPPWGDDSPSATVVGSKTPHGNEISVSVEPEPVVVISPDAEAATIAVFEQFALQPPSSKVAIFPKEDGGLRLQTVGDERAVVVDISATGTEFSGEYAGDDVYHSETFRNADNAAQFIIHSTR